MNAIVFTQVCHLASEVLDRLFGGVCDPTAVRGSAEGEARFGHVSFAV